MFPNEIWMKIVSYSSIQDLLEMRMTSNRMKSLADIALNEKLEQIYKSKGMDGVWLLAWMSDYEEQCMPAIVKIGIIRLAESTCLRQSPTRSDLGRRYKSIFAAKMARKRMSEVRKRDEWRYFLDEIVWKCRVMRMTIEWKKSCKCLEIEYME